MGKERRIERCLIEEVYINGRVKNGKSSALNITEELIDRRKDRQITRLYRSGP